MKVIAVASQKGGSGKTTLAGHLAVQAEMAGYGPVALVDTDPQGSLSEWWNEREAETPLFARTTVERLGADIGRMEQMGINLLIVDTPPAITSTIANVIGLSDLLIIPTRPSPHDLRAVGATVELAEGLNTPLIFVVNGATPRARITSEAAIALSQHGTLAPSVIHQRVDFAASMIDGRTTMELSPASKSSEEITKLWAYIGERLDRMETSTASVMPQAQMAASVSNGAVYN
ncbi:MAG: ParA family protein [Alphaproteobacteria bacterium]|nr:MAG: ParA family protein [Alphaproteobacteria bacterium]